MDKMVILEFKISEVANFSRYPKFIEFDLYRKSDKRKF